MKLPAILLGSTVEFGKVYQPADIGDFDVMISAKNDVVQVEDIEPISKHPGFVRVSINNDEFETSKEFFKATTLNKNFPKGVQDILKALPVLFPKHLKVEMTLEYKRICVAHKIETSSNFPPLETQLQDSELTLLQKEFILNMIRSNLYTNNVTDVESKVAKVSTELDQASKPQAPVDIKQLPNIWVNLINIPLSVQDQISKTSNKGYKSDSENRDLIELPVDSSKLPSHLQVVKLHSSVISSSLSELPLDLPELPSDLPRLPTDLSEFPTDLLVLPSDIPELPTYSPKVLKNLPIPSSNLPEVPEDLPTLPSQLPLLTSDLPGLVPDLRKSSSHLPKSELFPANSNPVQIKPDESVKSLEESSSMQTYRQQVRGKESSYDISQQKSSSPDTTNNFANNFDSTSYTYSETQDKFQQLLHKLFWENVNKSVDPLGSSTITLDPTDEPKKVDLLGTEIKAQSNEDLPRKSGIDLVMSKKLRGWPKNANYLFEKKRQENSKIDGKLLSLIKKSCIYIVAKHPGAMQAPEEIEYTFRMSFSHPEKVLCNNMNETQLTCYRLMKVLHNARFKNCSERFCSYHLKTTLFWAIEKNEINLWTAENLEICIALLLASLLDAIEDNYLEHYFIRNMNLFDGFTKGELEKLNVAIREILEDLTAAFQNISDQFKLKSRATVEKTCSPDATTSSSSQTQISPINFQEWSLKYDGMVIELLTNSSSPSFSKELKSTIQNIVAETKMTSYEFYTVFEAAKFGLFRKHCFILKDMQRPLHDVILETIEQ